MRNGFALSLFTLLAGTGLCLAQGTSVPEPRRVELVSTDAGSNYPAVAPVSGQVYSGPTNGYPEQTAGCSHCNGMGAGGCGMGSGCAACNGCGDGEPDCSKYQLYARGEYLLWHIDDTHLPPLLANTVVGVASVPLGGTSVVLPVLAQATFGAPGGRDVSFRDQNGARITVGYWLDEDHCMGLEFSGFGLARKNVTFNSDTGTNILSFPFTFMIPGVPSNTTPSILTLAARATLNATESTEMWGGEISGRAGKCWVGPVAFEGFGGFRYLDLEESLSSTESISLAGIANQSSIPFSSVPAGFVFFDSVQTRNQFYGAQLGGTIDWCMGPFFLNGTGKIGLGDMHQAVSIIGGATSLGPIPTTTPGGLITSPADFGQHTRERCAVVSEAGVNFGYNFGCHLRAFVGYNFLFLSSVVRPADEVAFSRTNLQVTVNNTPQSINVISPGFRFNSSELWANGCNFGLEFRY